MFTHYILRSGTHIQKLAGCAGVCSAPTAVLAYVTFVPSADRNVSRSQRVGYATAVFSDF
jgi:hypothetical protein